MERREGTCETLLYEFDKKSTAAPQERDRSCQDKARSGRLSHAGENDIDQAIRTNSNTIMQELNGYNSVYTGNVRETAG
ncbi:hypothetical protein TNCV_3729951 [Trichonephila clavipes]|nr:hypothetical protein TNCV_3729951 [Trichonephila clavipes]